MERLFTPQKQSTLANQLHQLHHTGETLIFLNVWDAVSAKMVEKMGFPAIATSSASMAWALGYKDGEKTPPDEIIAALRRICRVVDIPVTADIEGGYYRDDLEKFKQFISDVIDAGVVGINLEDGHAHSENLDSTEYHCQRIQIAKKVGEEKGINLFVNARTDAMILSKPMDEKIAICIEKSNAFAEAGADGIFIPFITEIEAIKSIKNNIKLPLNVLANKFLDINELKSLNIERISTGARPFMSLMDKFNIMGNTLQTSDSWEILYDESLGYDDVNGGF